MEYSKVFVKGLISFLFLASLGCQKSGSGADDGSPRDPWSKPDGPPAEGAINGRAWKFAQGKISTLQHRGKTVLIISLWNETFPDPCSESRGSSFQARLQVLEEEGSWPIDKNDPFKNYPLLIFSDLTSELRANHNMVANSGKITIKKIEKTWVSGQITGVFPGAGVGRTEISGSFIVPFCGSR
ncbi:hypothetical protein D3C87_112180 [compost metagenome]